MQTMTSDRVFAIRRWRQQVSDLPGGLEAFEQPQTVSTMLFGCYRWLESGGAELRSEEKSEIEAIVVELEEWMSRRGVKFLG